MKKLRKGFKSSACGEVKVKTGLDLFMLTYLANAHKTNTSGVSDSEVGIHVHFVS